ncbi:MAG: chromate resistance protein [Burkholderiales bacterium]|jgi:hypothetical protein|nr:chromate resistance protein [Burkholderiales bacterium]
MKVEITTNPDSTWQLLIASQPTGNAALRMRVWRETKSLGAAALRDGAYLLPPQASRGVFDTLAEQVRAAGGQAEVVAVRPTPEQSAQWQGLFDRAAQYAELYERSEALTREVEHGAAGDLLRELQSLEQAMQRVSAVDYFPGPAREQLRTRLGGLRQLVQRRLSPDEPLALADATLAPLSKRSYAAKTWATRRQLWIDRVASVWLIRRFIDPQARFVWLAKPADKPKRAIGFDFDGAEFTHCGGLITFEVLARRFQLDGDAAVARLATIVHALDSGGVPVAEAAGVETLLAGLRQIHPDDDAFAAASSAAFDAWYAAFAASPRPQAQRRRS